MAIDTKSFWSERAREALAREILKCAEKGQSPPDDPFEAVYEGVLRFLSGDVPLWDLPDEDDPVRGAIDGLPW